MEYIFYCILYGSNVKCYFLYYYRFFYLNFNIMYSEKCVLNSMWRYLGLFLVFVNNVFYDLKMYILFMLKRNIVIKWKFL